MNDTMATETPMSDHVARFWQTLETEHVRIIVDMRRDTSSVPYWDAASFGDDVAKALVADRRALSPPKRPDWNKVMAGCGGAHPDDNECVSVTRGTARLAASAIRTSQEEAAYHNFNAAEVELLAALRAMPLQDHASEARRLVDEQAKDEGLWFQAQTCAEAYVQTALRKLHAAIEGQGHDERS